MEKFYLEEPSIKRKEEALNYLNEFVSYNSEMNGTGSMDKCLKGLTYEDWLEKNELMKKTEFAYSINRCPAETFFLIRENDNKIIGMINVRFDLNEEMKQFGGHIGYGIRPTERRKGYNKINLYLGLKVALKQGTDNVMLACDATNPASSKTMLALGGILKRTYKDPYDGCLVEVYWIDANKALEKYRDTYESFVLGDNMEKRMNKNELLELIKTVKIDINEFTILSSSGLVLREILETAGDLDIAVTEKGLEQLKQNYNLVQKENGWYTVNDKIECVVDNMENRKELVLGYNTQEINDYLKYLKSSKREKDKARIPLVEEYINNFKTIK